MVLFVHLQHTFNAFLLADPPSVRWTESTLRQESVPSKRPTIHRAQQINPHCVNVTDQSQSVKEPTLADTSF